MVHFEILDKSRYDSVLTLIKEKRVTTAIASSVAELPEGLFDELQKILNKFIVLDHNTPIPIQNDYDTKETLGKDRLAAVVGANFIYPHENVLVIDAGSAITYDIINDKGIYLGGNIAPGIQMRYKALHTFTRRLPLVAPVNNVPDYGRNTEDAIRVGVQLGIVHEIDGTISFFKEKYPNLKVLATGGDVKYFDNKLKNVIFAVSNLVLVGLNRILHYNN